MEKKTEKRGFGCIDFLVWRVERKNRGPKYTSRLKLKISGKRKDRVRKIKAARQGRGPKTAKGQKSFCSKKRDERTTTAGVWGGEDLQTFLRGGEETGERTKEFTEEGRSHLAREKGQSKGKNYIEKVTGGRRGRRNKRAAHTEN